VGEGDGTLHTDNDSGCNMSSGSDDAPVSEGTGSGGILATGEGEGALHGDDGSGALRGDFGTDTLSDGGGLNVCILDGTDTSCLHGSDSGHKRSILTCPRCYSL
jgi:hypothetical protein